MALGSLWIMPGAKAQTPPAGPRFGENFRLTSPDTPGRGRDVPGLAVNPINPNHIVEADVDYLNGECDFHTSFDGGATWSGGHLRAKNSGENPPFSPNPCDQNFDSGGYAHFNTSIIFGTGLNVYVAFSAHRGPFNRPEGGCVPVTPTCPTGPREGGAGDDTLVARSTDGGRTFAPAEIAIPGAPSVAPYAIRSQVAVERGAGTGGADRLYATAWQCHIKLRTGETRLGGCSGGGGDRRQLVARSDDAGQTWRPTVIASAVNVRTGADAANAASPDEQMREPSEPVVGPDGAVYMAWRNRDLTPGTSCPPTSAANCIVVARSTDRGQTWRQFSTGVDLGTAFIGHPRLAIDPGRPSGPGTPGTLYVVFQGGTGSDPEVILQKSVDGGQTWTNGASGAQGSFVRVNDDPGGVIQSNPYVSVAADGRVDVVWRDRRHNYPGADLNDIYYASSSNAGATFSANRRVTDRSFNRNVGLTGLGGYTWYGPVVKPLSPTRVLVAWTDSREGDANTGIQDVYLSRLDIAAPLADKRIVTQTTPGLSVALSRIAYTGGNETVGNERVTKVVVANQGDVASALAGAVLARANYAPLLLSPPEGLPANVKADAIRLEPAGAFVLGDSTQLSDAVIRDLSAATPGGENVVRISGRTSIVTADRPADMARQVAENLRPLPNPTSPEAIIVNPGISPARPEAAATAASASALAAALRIPILFVDDRQATAPTNPALGSAIPAPTEAALASLGIKNVLIAGGTNIVNQQVEDRLKNPTTNPAPTRGLGLAVRRLGGADQYATSEALLAEARTRGMATNVVYVADGNRAIDAATLGAAVGRLNGLMLLSPSADTTLAKARLAALGYDGPADRLVAAVGTGGTDPVATTQDPGGPETTGGDPGRLAGVSADSGGGATPAVARSTRRASSSGSTATRSRAAARPSSRVASASTPSAAPAPAPVATPAVAQPTTSGAVAAPSFPRAIGLQRPSGDDDDGGGLPTWPLAVLALVAFGAGTGAFGWFTGRRQLRAG
jgi:putative cell wall-binding protein